jgi:ubiquinone/menaquinone biosynthesis C-methylase UbiE
MADESEVKKSFNWINTNKNEEVIVTGREYAQVTESLHLPDSYLAKGKQILSVGEGLSDFAKQLRQRYGVMAIAVDPIYLAGKSLFNNNPERVRPILNRLEGISYRPEYAHDREKNPLTDRKKVVAGSVYELPFMPNSFDLVCSNRVFEHTNLLLQLPELISVLKEGGEIRLAGCWFDLLPQISKLHPYYTKYHGMHGFYRYMGKDADKGLDWLISQSGISSYIFTTELPKRSEVRHEGIYNGDILIIRKDEVLPSFIPVEEEEKHRKEYGKDVPRYYPDLGRLFKIISRDEEGNFNVALVGEDK